MLEGVKKKIITIQLVIILMLSSIMIYVNLGNLENIFFKKESEVIHDNSLVNNEETNPIEVKVKELTNQLEVSMISNYIKKLTSFGPHPTTRRIISKIIPWELPIEKVREYIYNELLSMNLDVRRQPWAQKMTLENWRKPKWFHGWFEGVNIEATLHGTDEDSDEIYVMIAHYDTWPRSPGANDDSSGVATVLSAAKLMSRYSFNHTVRFVLVDGEEQALLGSCEYVEEAKRNNDNIVATFCIDMIGNRGPEYKDDEVIITIKKTSWVTDFTYDVNRRYPELLNFTIYKDKFENHFSDHREFINDGFDAICVGEAVEDEDWHKPSDIVDNMDVNYATKVAKLILATIAEMAWDTVSVQ